MEEKVLHKLEYPKIINMLAERCSFQLGKELAENLRPSFNCEEIKKWQSETTEAKEVLRLYPRFILGGVHDLRPSLGRPSWEA